MSSLKNHIIISMPHMNDLSFGRSVVLICEHDTNGAMGFVINKPFETPELKELFFGLFPEEEDILKLIPTVHFGGPVLVARGIVLHSADYETEGTMKMGDDFSLTSNKGIVRDIVAEKGPRYYKLMFGHAGWTQHQLESEIENGDWLLQNTNLDFVFNTDEKFMWDLAAKSFGIDITHFSGFGGSA